MMKLFSWYFNLIFKYIYTVSKTFLWGRHHYIVTQITTSSESQSELLYAWQFTANQFILATTPLEDHGH
jgi:hypothetical protein